jgi:putative tryptophan/tyrosine transport system substrate-binding protein
LAQRIANDAHQIFNGSIPFYQPNKFQLIVNARSARELGLPAILIARADEVIE